MATLTTVCAWCVPQKVLKIEAYNADKDAISHGMCKECADKIKAEYGLK